MLEQIASAYISQSTEGQRLISYGVTVLGAIVAGIFCKSVSELERAPYFAYYGLLFFIAAASQVIWLGSIPAMTGGFIWIFMLVDIVAALGIGFAIGIIAMARSRDAYGHAGMAALAFIPIANFWLLSTPSRKKLSANRVPTILLLTGSLGILTGFVLLIAGVLLSAFIQVETNRLVAEAENDPALQRSGMDMMLRGQGLEETLRQMAAEVPSQRVDETTTLLRVVSKGTTLQYVYEVLNNLNVIPNSMRTSFVQHHCTNAALRPVIDTGATIEHVYQKINGREIGRVIISHEICEKFEATQSAGNDPDTMSIDIEQELKMAAMQLRENLPQQIDQVTRLENIEADGLSLIYYYTAAIERDQLYNVKSFIFPNMIGNFCSSKTQRQAMREDGVRYIYSYNNSNEEFLFSLSVSESVCAEAGY